MAFIAAIPAAYLAAATAAASVASAVASASAQHASAESAARAAQYNQEVANQRAVVANQQASANADASERQSDLALGSVLATGAQNNTGLGGSTGSLYEQDATNAEMTAMNIRYNGALNASALENGAQLDQYQSSVDQMNASNATTSGIIGAGDDLEQILTDIQVDAGTWVIVLDLRDSEDDAADALRATPSFETRPAPKWIKQKIDLNGAYVDDDGRPLPRQEAVAPVRPISFRAFGLDIDIES